MRETKKIVRTHICNLRVIIRPRVLYRVCRFSGLATNYCRFKSNGIVTYQVPWYAIKATDCLLDSYGILPAGRCCNIRSAQVQPRPGARVRAAQVSMGVR